MTQSEASLPGDVLRTLAGAATAFRLYPPTSQLPAEAVARCVEVANAQTARLGPMRFVVGPKTFTWNDEVVGMGNIQIETLAQALYSHQIGQLLIAPGMTPGDVVAFVACIGRGKAELKDEGGVTTALVAAGVSSLAVVEMSVRASTEAGLGGIDLLDAPLDDIGADMARATERWAQTAATGTGVDEAAQAMDALADATREIAASRMGDALLRLDEDARIRVLANARQKDASGRPMEGMFRTIGQMSPGALSRLLTLAAASSGESPLDLLPELGLTPDLLRLLTMMLSPSPQALEDRGVPADPDIDTTARIMAEEDPREQEELARQVSTSAPALAAGRALATACILAISRDDDEGIRAIGDALAPALRSGAFAQVSDALTYLDQAAEQPARTAEASRARLTLADPGLLHDACVADDDSLTPEILARIVSAAGDMGHEAFISCWSATDDPTRERLRPTLERLGDGIIVAAGRIAREGEASVALEAIALLGSLDDSRAVPILSQLLQSPDRHVRQSALEALADTGGPEGIRALISALGQYHLVERDVLFKTEVIRTIVALGITDAVPVLEGIAGRRFVFGSGNVMLRSTARKAIVTLRTGRDRERRGQGD